MKRWWIPALVLAVTVMAGCSKDEGPTQPPQPGNYMPLAVGNWWVYRNAQLDTSGREKPGMVWRDSVIVVGTVQKAGKNAYVLVHYTEWWQDTSYLAREGTKLYMYTDTLGSEDPFALFGPWVPMVDLSGRSWSEQRNMRLENAAVDGYRGTFVGVAQLSGRRVGHEQATIRERNQTVQAEKFELKLNINGNLEAPGVRIPVQYLEVIELWFAENIGQVAHRAEAPLLTWQPPSLPPRQQRMEEGRAVVLLNYWVQQ